MSTPTPAETNRQASENACEACKQLAATLTLVNPNALTIIFHEVGTRDKFSTPPEIIIRPGGDGYNGMLEAIKRLNELVVAGLNYSPDLE